MFVFVPIKLDFFYSINVYIAISYNIFRRYSVGDNLYIFRVVIFVKCDICSNPKKHSMWHRGFCISPCSSFRSLFHIVLAHCLLLLLLDHALLRFFKSGNFGLSTVYVLSSMARSTWGPDLTKLGFWLCLSIQYLLFRRTKLWYFVTEKLKIWGFHCQEHFFWIKKIWFLQIFYIFM